MSDQAFHRLVLCCGAFVLLLIVFAFVIMPWMGLLLLVLTVALTLLVLNVWPRFARVERTCWQDGTARTKAWLKAKLNGNAPQPVEYDNRFVPDHVLVSMNPSCPMRVVIDQEDFLIGRDASCQLRLKSYPTVGGQHCRIIYMKYSHAWYIEDMHSVNGTYIGKRRLEPFKREKLLDGTEISIANFRMRFEKQAGG